MVSLFRSVSHGEYTVVSFNTYVQSSGKNYHKIDFVEFSSSHKATISAESSLFTFRIRRNKNITGKWVQIRDLKMEFVYFFQREPKHNKPVTDLKNTKYSYRL